MGHTSFAQVASRCPMAPEASEAPSFAKTPFKLCQQHFVLDSQRMQQMKVLLPPLPRNLSSGSTLNSHCLLSTSHPFIIF